MNKILTLLFALIVLHSCEEKKNYDNIDKLCKTLGEITANDQKYRGSSEMTDPFFGVLDSLKTANNISNKAYSNLSRETQLEWEKKARVIADKIPQMSQQKQDSLMQLQIEIDNTNTELLIDIIKERGWVYKNDLGCEEYVSAWLVFRHSQTQYWDEIRAVIEKEKTENRIGEGDYKMIDNHIKGRPMLENLNINK